MKTVVMLATPHLINRPPGNGRAADLRGCLDYLRQRFNPQIVMEEWSEKGNESVASAFCHEVRPDGALPWVNVGTPDEPEYRTYWGPINYPGYKGTLTHDPDAPGMYEYGPFRKQENRERRIVSNVRSQMERYEMGLVVVGTAHLHSLFGKLQSAGLGVVAFSWL